MEQEHFHNQIFSVLEIGQKAKVIRGMVKKYIHTEDDFERLMKLITQYGRNNIHFCLCKLK